MTTNQEGVHAAIRAETGTSGSYLSDWHALFDSDGITAGPWGSRMIAWVNQTLGTSYTNLNTAMNAFAIDQGFTSWQDMNTLVLAVSGAMEMLDGEAQGLAFDFTDDHWAASEGFYGSVAIKDTGTPANNYDSSPTKAASSLLTYASPSPKLTMGPDGLYRYQAHNLYLNSAAPANQNITVVSGAAYAVTITGSVSVTASGAATGTWTAGTQTFTAATTTLTLGSTSGSGTVHVRRTPSDSTYLATTSAARYDLPYQWDASGNLEGILVEEARTNLVTYPNDWTQGIYSGTSVTSAKNATGPDGVANSASTLTASGVGGMRYVAAYYGSTNTTRTQSVFAKRKTGSGPIYFALGINYSYLPTSAPTTTGSDLVTNGNFSGGATGWTTTGTSGVDTVTFDGATARIVTTTTVNTGFYQSIATTVGKTYLITFTATVTSGRAVVGRATSFSGGFSSTGTYSVCVTANSATTAIFFSVGTTTSDVTYDNVTCYETTIDNAVTLSTTEWTQISRTYLTHPGVVGALGAGFAIPTSGDAIEVAYFQNEAGTFPTSPIETFGSSVTRAVDNISLATSAFPYSATAGTMFVDVASASSAAAIFIIADGTANERYLVYLSGTTASMRIVDGGVTQAELSTGVNGTTGAFKIAGAFAANDAAAVANGGAAATDATVTLPTVTTAYFGQNQTATATTNGIIKKFVYLPRRMSNAELQALTA